MGWVITPGSTCVCGSVLVLVSNVLTRTFQNKKRLCEKKMFVFVSLCWWDTY